MPRRWSRPCPQGERDARRRPAHVRGDGRPPRGHGPGRAQQCRLLRTDPRRPLDLPVVYMDAALPAAGVTETLLAPAAVRRASSSTLPQTDGLLPPWPAWWDRADVVALFPDEDWLDRVTREAPRLAPEYFTTPLPVPLGWEARPAAYLAFGDTYAEEVAFAEQAGWVVRREDGHHLQHLAEPDHVADLLLDLVVELRPQSLRSPRSASGRASARLGQSRACVSWADGRRSRGVGEMLGGDRCVASRPADGQRRASVGVVISTAVRACSPGRARGPRRVRTDRGRGVAHQRCACERHIGRPSALRRMPMLELRRRRCPIRRRDATTARRCPGQECASHRRRRRDAEGRSARFPAGDSGRSAMGPSRPVRSSSGARCRPSGEDRSCQVDGPWSSMAPGFAVSVGQCSAKIVRR